MTTFQKIISSVLGFSILIPGLAKFTDKFSHDFQVQIANGNIPFPELSFQAGRLGEIFLGSSLIFLAFFSNKLSEKTTDQLFYFSNVMIVVFMTLAIYIHLHPNIPVEVLPFEYKPPVMAISILILVGVNIYSHRKTRFKN